MRFCFGSAFLPAPFPLLCLEAISVESIDKWSWWIWVHAIRLLDSGWVSSFNLLISLDLRRMLILWVFIKAVLFIIFKFWISGHAVSDSDTLWCLRFAKVNQVRQVCIGRTDIVDLYLVDGGWNACHFIPFVRFHFSYLYHLSFRYPGCCLIWRRLNRFYRLLLNLILLFFILNDNIVFCFPLLNLFIYLSTFSIALHALSLG